MPASTMLRTRWNQTAPRRLKPSAHRSHDTVNGLGVNATQFADFMKDATNVGNVSEHWADVINPKKSRQHSHLSRAGLKMSVDETSLIVLGPDELYIGSLNFRDVHEFILLSLKQIDERAIERSST